MKAFGCKIKNTLGGRVLCTVLFCGVNGPNRLEATVLEPRAVTACGSQIAETAISAEGRGLGDTMGDLHCAPET